jgi:hypothetical protein
LIREIHAQLAHAQFETIHPFLDGNGRVGRLLITFLLCQRSILKSPLLYLSHYLKFHRVEYYDRLMAIRNDGHWEAWLKFFFKGVSEVSRSATDGPPHIGAAAGSSNPDPQQNRQSNERPRAARLSAFARIRELRHPLGREFPFVAALAGGTTNQTVFIKGLNLGFLIC